MSSAWKNLATILTKDRKEGIKRLANQQKDQEEFEIII